MKPSSFDPMAGLPKPAAEAMAFWISFFPTAPLFGVEWRFAQFFPAAPAMSAGFGLPAAPKGSPKGARSVTIEAVAVEIKAPATAKAAEAPTPAPQPKTVPEPAATVQATPEPAPKPAAKLRIVEPAAPVAPEPDPAPAGPARPAALLAAAPPAPDDLKLLKGVGPALEKQLNGLGVWTFAQLAAMSEDDLRWVDDNLTSFKGRCFRDDWIGQAKALANG